MAVRSTSRGRSGMRCAAPDRTLSQAEGDSTSGNNERENKRNNGKLDLHTNSETVYRSTLRLCRW